MFRYVGFYFYMYDKKSCCINEQALVRETFSLKGLSIFVFLSNSANDIKKLSSEWANEILVMTFDITTLGRENNKSWSRGEGWG